MDNIIENKECFSYEERWTLSVELLNAFLINDMSIDELKISYNCTIKIDLYFQLIMNLHTIEVFFDVSSSMNGRIYDFFVRLIFHLISVFHFWFDGHGIYQQSWYILLKVN